MPELPEVQTVVSGLVPHVVGRRVASVRLARADVVYPPEAELVTHLLGREIVSVHRRGKKIVFTLDSADRFVIHLGMSGQLTLDAADVPVPKHTHLIVEFDDLPLQLRFKDPRRFGGIWWHGQDDTVDTTMGPEPLSVHWRLLARRLRKTRRPIKTMLLDQAVVAGIGNIYADESLFEAGIHPLTPAGMLNDEQMRRLTRAIKLILRRAIRAKGSTLRDYRGADGSAGSFQARHRVYDRATLPCRSCKTPIVRVVLGGRSTHYCPACQPQVISTLS